MGSCCSIPNSYSALKKSFFSSILTNEQELQDFFSLCTVERFTLTSNIHITSSVAFYLVLSGELNISLSVKDSKPVVVRTIEENDIVFFFQTNTYPGVISNGSILYGNIKLHLNFNNKETFSHVLSMTYANLNEFLSTRPHLKLLKDLSNINVSDFVKNSSFESFTPQQVSIFINLIFFYICIIYIFIYLYIYYYF